MTNKYAYAKFVGAMARTRKSAKKPRPSSSAVLRRKKFVAAYIEDPHATRAAMAAGCPKTGARTQGSRFLRHPDVRAAIDAHFAKIAMGSDEILAELAHVARGNMANYASWGPSGVSIRKSDDLTDDLTAAVAELSEKDTEFGKELKFKLHGKVDALNSLARIKGLFIERHEHEHKVSFADLVDAAAARTKGAA